MGKKTKKNRFNKSVDVDVVYSSNTIAEVDPTDNLAELNLSKEKAEELQKIRAKLPSFSQTYSLDAELAKLPTEKPFRAFVHNMAFSANENDIAAFFSPLEITNINLVSGGSGSRGFCFVDFATREDLAKALEKNDCPLAGRPVNVRIADPNTNDRGGGGSYGRDRSGFGGPRRGDMGSGGGGYGRRTGGYRPGALKDELPESSGGGWRREGPITSSRPSYGFGRTTGEFARGSGDFSRPSFTAAVTATPPTRAEPTLDRPKLHVLPRTAPLTRNDEEPPRNPKIFGLAKPVDTASKDRLIGERLSQSSAAGLP